MPQLIEFQNRESLRVHGRLNLNTGIVLTPSPIGRGRGMRVRSLARKRRKLFCLVREAEPRELRTENGSHYVAARPHPNPLPKGEGFNHLNPFPLCSLFPLGVYSSTSNTPKKGIHTCPQFQLQSRM